jgi:hypothetical protein
VTHLRPTVWPGQHIQSPAVEVFDDVAVHGEWLELLGEAHEVELPADFYLAEMGSQTPTSVDEAAAFVQTWGRTVDPDDRDLPTNRDFRKLVVEPWMQQADLLPQGDLMSSLHELRQRLGRPDIWRDRFVHAGEVLWRASSMHYLARIATLIGNNEEIEESDAGAFQNLVNGALSAFQVRLQVPGQPSVAVAETTAYSVAALQIANDLAAGVPYRQCANETCGNTYTVHRDRGQYYHRTSGTRYCCKTCARAQAERERRRRLKQAGG